MAILGNHLLVITEEVLLTSGCQRPGMMLNILQYIGQLAQQRLILPKMSIMLRLTNPVLGDRDISINKIYRISAFMELTF